MTVSTIGFLGVCNRAFRESARFAILRSGVRSPYGPPKQYQTNTYFFKGGFAVKVILWYRLQKHRFELIEAVLLLWNRTFLVLLSLQYNGTAKGVYIMKSNLENAGVWGRHRYEYLRKTRQPLVQVQYGKPEIVLVVKMTSRTIIIHFFIFLLHFR